MKHVLAAIVVVFLIFSFATPSASTGDGGMFFLGLRFIGLWQGIDPLDGSDSLRSITLDEDGTFNIIGYESYFTGCDGGRGTAFGEGSLIQGELEAKLTLKCVDGPTIENIQTRYVFDGRNRTLKEEIPPFPTVIYHRISRL